VLNVSVHSRTGQSAKVCMTRMPGRNQQMMVDSHIAKFVDDNRDPLAVSRGQNAVEKRGFSGTQEPGNNDRWYL
jgi:hypothetical protein